MFDKDSTRLLKAREVAEILSVDRSTVYRLAEEGTLPCVRVSGDIVRFDPRVLADWYGEASR